MKYWPFDGILHWHRVAIVWSASISSKDITNNRRLFLIRRLFFRPRSLFTAFSIATTCLQYLNQRRLLPLALRTFFASSDRGDDGLSSGPKSKMKLSPQNGRHPQTDSHASRR